MLTAETTDQEYVRKITDLTSALLTDEEAAFLYTLPDKIPAGGSIVEIGSYKGGSAILLAAGSKRAGKEKVYAVDPHFKSEGFYIGNEFVPPETLPVFLRNIKEAGMDDWIIPVIKTSSEAARGWKRPVSLLWIDGDHRYWPVKSDFLMWEKYLVEGGIIALHDTRESLAISRACGYRTGHIDVRSGPSKVVMHHLMDSPRFRDILACDSITYARKIKKSGVFESLKNTFISNLSSGMARRVQG